MGSFQTLADSDDSDEYCGNNGGVDSESSDGDGCCPEGRCS